jgi:ankyrin repeat protein
MPIHLAVWSGSIETVGLLLSYGVDINVRGEDKATPLTYAANMGKVQMIQFLFENGADPTMLDGGGRTPLQAALVRGRQVPEAVKYLRHISSLQ